MHQRRNEFNTAFVVSLCCWQFPCCVIIKQKEGLRLPKALPLRACERGGKVWTDWENSAKAATPPGTTNTYSQALHNKTSSCPSARQPTRTLFPTHYKRYACAHCLADNILSRPLLTLTSAAPWYLSLIHI